MLYVPYIVLQSSSIFSFIMVVLCFPLSIITSVTGTSSIPDHQPLSRSLNFPLRSQDTIHEGVDGPENDTRDSLWMRNGGQVRARGRRRRTSSALRMVMWVITEDNRLQLPPT